MIMVETIIYLNEENTRTATEDSEKVFIDFLKRIKEDQHSVSYFKYFPDNRTYFKNNREGNKFYLNYMKNFNPTDFSALNDIKSEVCANLKKKTPSMIATIESIDPEMRDSYEIHFCNNVNKLHMFYDYYLRKFNHDEKFFIEFCKLRYNNLFFVDGFHSEVKKYSRKYNDLREKLFISFNVLNNWDDNKMGNPSYESELKTLLKGIFDISKDKEDDIKKTKYERTIYIKGCEVVYDWHIKFEKHIGRFHFAPEKNYRNAHGKKVLVGRLLDHYKTK